MDRFDPKSHGWRLAPHPGFTEMLGALWERQEVDTLALGLFVSPDLLSSVNQLEAGALMTFVDHAIGHASIPVFGTLQVTIQLQLSIVAPVVAGAFLEGRGRIAGIDESLAYLDGQITCEEKIVATASGIWKRVRPLD